MQTEKMLVYLKNHVDKERFVHSVGTAKTAERLAVRHGADAGKAYAAGLLHDIAKDKCGTELKKYTVMYGIVADVTECENPSLLHGQLGAAMARRELGVTDEDILGAIRWHTTGRAGMSLLEKIVYLADLIEPSRRFKGIDAIRRLADCDIDAAMSAALLQVMDFVQRKGFALHPNSLMAYNECHNKGGEKLI